MVWLVSISQCPCWTQNVFFRQTSSWTNILSQHCDFRVGLFNQWKIGKCSETNHFENSNWVTISFGYASASHVYDIRKHWSYTKISCSLGGFYCHRGDCSVPKRKSAFSQSAFSYKAIKEWNGLPDNLKNNADFYSFSRTVNDWLLDHQSCSQ